LGSRSPRLRPSEAEAWHVRLGRISYERAFAIQRLAHRLRREGRIPDILLTLEHDPPVFTCGRSAGAGGLAAEADEIARSGIPILHVDRGGDITYHGPGQLVVYPIVDLRRLGKDVREHIKRLEEAAIRTVAEYGVCAARRPGYPGVWVEPGKLASVGVYVKDWVTRHGLALNVDVNREHFAMIRPCGLPVRAVSLVELLGRPVRLDEVEATFVARATEVFEWNASSRGLECLGEERDD
jgi:lipoate-protein ligase B